MKMTTRELAALEAGKWLSDDAAKGAGRLVAYGTKDGGATFYFRYTKPDGARDALPMGRYSANGQDGLTLAQARTLAGDYSRRYQAGERDLRTALDAERQVAERKRAILARKEEQDGLVTAGSLGMVLRAYVEMLGAKGKESARQVDSAFRRHIQRAHPELWVMPVAEVSMDHLIDAIRPLTAEGKLREADKLRSYMKSAFTAAIRARQDARAPAALSALNITHNPAADIVAIEGANNARERALSEAELYAYYQRLQALPSPEGAVLRFHMLSGAQRVEQLARLKPKDYDSDTQTIRLRDGKGRREKPRIHDVPLVPAAVEAMEAMGRGTHLFSFYGGKSPATGNAVQARIRAIAADMLAAGELDENQGAFTMGDLRRTVETRLSAVGVPPHVMAVLQSHGLGGVQMKHYNKHTYREEMTDALMLLHALMTTDPRKRKPAKVVSMARWRRK